MSEQDKVREVMMSEEAASKSEWAKELLLI